MAARPFTPAWAVNLRDAINASDEYREAGRTWAWPLALVLDPHPNLDYPDAVAVVLDLKDGICHRVTCEPAVSVDAPFTVRGEYEVWKRVMLGQLDPIAAIVQGKLRLTGSLGTVVRHVGAAQALVECATRVPTEFPDER